ncbi:uncharacterized protein MYCFIDRAFT_200510 [Pseudocercospora fijiensis CIRAD86]|uniref:Uncharacterized protein n=1 Tax=Pseudocercospora fijiensis (strain CIRAD86) TaxID=383855 RepID=M3ALA0_PSEFD|nr:uncharacterized protein MYCFIDRAFT_200510 [Pseudocercospora fijiensis CIRAD86]EME78212.1 hypothetical protein MYCFIDRAFT_200510 [Pseudocercospora fijiensis CIRAD86]
MQLSTLRKIDLEALPKVDDESDDADGVGQDIDEDIYDDEQAVLNEVSAKTEKTSIKRSTWALMVEKGLELMCLHDTHLWQFTVFDSENPSVTEQRISDWILNSKIAVVDIQLVKGSDSEHSRTEEEAAQHLSDRIERTKIEKRLPQPAKVYSTDNLPSEAAHEHEAKTKREFEGIDDQNRPRSEKYDDEPPKDDTSPSVNPTQ